MVVLSLAVLALKAQAIEVQPAILELQTDPGNGKQAYIRLTNDEQQTSTFLVTVQKFIPSGERGQQEFLPPDDTSGLPEWTFVDAPTVTLKPGQSINFPVSFRIPANASAGTYTEAVFFSLAGEPGQGSVATTPRIGALVFFTVNGALVERQTISSFHADKNVFAKLPAELTVQIKNDGNVVELPTGTVFISNVFGSKVAQFPVNPNGSRLLPASARTFTMAWNDEWAFGPYKATVSMDKTQPEQSSITIYVWNFRWLSYGAGGLLLLVIAYFGLKKLILTRATR